MPGTATPGVVLTQGPSTGLSLHNSTRNTVAEGSSTPARACTPWVIRPSTGSGRNDTAAETVSSTAYPV